MHIDLATPAALRTTPRQDAITLALGAWLVLGVFADGWAHFSVPSLESFFTPWHGALYSGLAVTIGWSHCSRCRGGARVGHSSARCRRAIGRAP